MGHLKVEDEAIEEEQIINEFILKMLLISGGLKRL